MMPQWVLLEARGWRLGLLAIALAGLCFAAMALRPDSAWGQFVGRLCVFPVLAAALWYGWRGGAACALAASLGLAVV